MNICFRRLTLSSPSASLRNSLGGSDDHRITAKPAALETSTDAARTAQRKIPRSARDFACGLHPFDYAQGHARKTAQDMYYFALEPAMEIG